MISMRQNFICAGHKSAGGGLGGKFPYYFSEKIKTKFEILAMSKTAVIEAPSGYGKTTAMREYLKDRQAHGEAVRCFTSVDEAPPAMYARLCREIGKIDEPAGKRLEEIKFPDAFTMGEVCDILREIGCEQSTWLVLDDSHYLLEALPEPVLTALLCHAGKNLNVVFITRRLKNKMLTAILGYGILHLRAEYLRWDAQDIRKYFKQAGADISSEAAAEVYRRTEGWIIAVYLQLCSWHETGEFSQAAVCQLMENLIWNKLSTEQQNMFMIASPFKGFTAAQLCVLLGREMLPEYAKEALTIPFIGYSSGQNRYEPHNVLSELFASKRREMGEGFDRRCLKSAGDLCRDERNIAGAMDFYAQIKDYKSLLSLNLDRHANTEFEDGAFLGIALEIVRECPREIRLDYPLSMLHIAWALRLMDDEDQAFKALMEELDGILPKAGSLRAEWLLLSCYLHFPVLEEMLKIVREAAVMFEGTYSRVILPAAPWAFYEYVQLTAFHVQPGKADLEAELLEEFLNIYSALTGGHGSGAGALFRAELALCRGETARAEVLAYKAIFQAESKNQKVIRIGAAKTLGAVALLKADTNGWKHALVTLESIARIEARSIAIKMASEAARGFLLAELKDFGRVADWLKNAQFLQQRMPPSIRKNGFATYVLCLINQGDYAQVIGLEQAVLSESFTVFAEILHHMSLAVGFLAIGDNFQAADCLRKAARLAMPDGLLHYFSGFAPLLRELTDELVATEYPEFLSKFDGHKNQYAAGWKALHGSIAASSLPAALTEREREIAQLAADGLRNQEIAEMLFVSENTVRAHLRTIYQKLNIDRRAKLAKMLD